MPSFPRVLTALLVCAAAVSVPLPPASAAPPPPLTFALLGDTPYGDEQRVIFPALVEDINAEPGVRMVLHAGDVKNGSSRCDDARFADLVGLYNTFKDPFVITPGDNEWTDCHRVAAGQYLPTERLAAFRETFFPVPGRTLGQRTMSVTDQPGEQRRHRAYVENVRFERAGVVFTTVHVVGSENDLVPWAELEGGDRPAVRFSEFLQRRNANLAWINAAFDRAESADAVGVLLMLQAEPTDSNGFQAERALIAARATEFARPVLLVHGDEHVYEAEPGYAGVPNMTRLETFGDTATEWLKVSVDPSSAAVFTWEPQSVPS